MASPRLLARFHRRRYPPSTAVSACCPFAPPRPLSLRDCSSAGMSPPKPSTLIRRAACLFTLLTLSLLMLYTATDSIRFLHLPSASLSSSTLVRIFPSYLNNSPSPNPMQHLKEVLGNASMGNNTVILTTLNDAWASTNSDVDFQEEAYFMTPNYLKMMWRRIDFLRSVLELGYNFVFTVFSFSLFGKLNIINLTKLVQFEIGLTDTDIMWFRDPFLQFFPDADFQIACDHFFGDPDDLNNMPNGGFNYVKSNNRSIAFYKFWYASHETYPGYHDQDVFNKIKFDPLISDIGLKIRFLDTAYFGGLCEPSKDLNLVCTMHANCCYGMDSKLHDLKIMLQDWRAFTSLPPDLKNESVISWRVPQNCSLHSLRHFDSPSPEINVEQEEEN
ncbi:Nucleotide-diphospho-sugar transferase family protein [Gossypium australe]|uniref:Nucleotide-diphospho-sugar transferase family protein n=1 Tax=Gossypium australe TaxID=47621 RepID=A0A5B6WQE5_9ROSI|nr:Nucleotide-diphospho-sugar transferase family protein [Gossypium australe]